jgi:hypothetical protein
VRAWVASRLAEHPTSEITAIEATPDGVRWRYRTATDQTRQFGVAPLEGRAEAVVRRGAIAVYTYAFDDGPTRALSAAQDAALAAAVPRPAAAPAGPNGTVPFGPGPGGARSMAAWGGAAVLVVLLPIGVMALGRRRAP